MTPIIECDLIFRVSLEMMVKFKNGTMKSIYRPSLINNDSSENDKIISVIRI